MPRESTLSHRVRQIVKDSGGFYLRIENNCGPGTFDSWIVLNGKETWCELKYCSKPTVTGGLLKNNHPLSVDQINMARILVRQKVRAFVLVGMKWRNRDYFLVPAEHAPEMNEWVEKDYSPYVLTAQQLGHVLGGR